MALPELSTPVPCQHTRALQTGTNVIEEAIYFIEPRANEREIWTTDGRCLAVQAGSQGDATTFAFQTCTAGTTPAKFKVTELTDTDSNRCDSSRNTWDAGTNAGGCVSGCTYGQLWSPGYLDFGGGWKAMGNKGMPWWECAQLCASSADCSYWLLQLGNQCKMNKKKFDPANPPVPTWIRTNDKHASGMKDLRCKVPSASSCAKGEFTVAATRTAERRCQPCGAWSYQSSSQSTATACTAQPTCGKGTANSGTSTTEKRGCEPCGAFEYQDQDNIHVDKCMAQPKCSKGLRNSGASNTARHACVACKVGFYQDQADTNTATCQPHTKCGAGYKYFAQYNGVFTATEKMTCGRCNAYEYQNSTSFAGFQCTPQPKCEAGWRYVSGKWDRGALRTCEECRPWQYLTKERTVAEFAASCNAQPTCGRGFKNSGDSTTAKHDCEACGRFEYQNLTAYQGTACMKQPNCTAGTYYYRPDQANATVSRATCETCPVGQYQPSLEHRNTTCLPHPPCRSGQKLARAMDPTALVACVACPPRTYQNATGHYATQCIPQPVCGPGQRFTPTPTPNSTVSLAARATCRPCADATYQAHSRHQNISCTTQPYCSGDQFITAHSPQRVGPQLCNPCPAGQSQRFQRHRNATCSDITTTLAAATITSGAAVGNGEGGKPGSNVGLPGTKNMVAVTNTSVGGNVSVSSVSSGSADSSGDGDAPIGLIAGAAGGGVVLIIIIIMVAVMRSKRAEKTTLRSGRGRSTRHTHGTAATTGNAQQSLELDPIDDAHYPSSVGLYEPIGRERSSFGNEVAAGVHGKDLPSDGIYENTGKGANQSGDGLIYENNLDFTSSSPSKTSAIPGASAGGVIYADIRNEDGLIYESNLDLVLGGSTALHTADTDTDTGMGAVTYAAINTPSMDPPSTPSSPTTPTFGELSSPVRRLSSTV